MFSSILVVCVGNICRSPTAEYMLRKQLSEKGRSVRVESAGIAALVDKGAEKTAAKMALETGVDMAPHKARQLTEKMIHEYDLVLVMEQGHIKAVEALAPTSRGKVHLLGRWNKNIEIPDPYRKGDAAFEHALSLIQQSVDHWVKRL